MENFRSKVFRRAHFIKTESGQTFAKALTTAWRVYRLQKAMRGNVVKFSFLKKDGSVRNAEGTLQAPILGDVKGIRAFNPKVVNYYDTEKLAFRCFQSQSLLNVA